MFTNNIVKCIVHLIIYIEAIIAFIDLVSADMKCFALNGPMSK